MTVRQYTMSPDHLDLFSAGVAHPAFSHVREALLQAVEALPHRHREVIDALYWERLGQRHAAPELGISRRTLNRIRDEAVEMIRVHLASAAIQHGFLLWVSGR